MMATRRWGPRPARAASPRAAPSTWTASSDHEIACVGVLRAHSCGRSAARRPIGVAFMDGVPPRGSGTWVLRFRPWRDAVFVLLYLKRFFIATLLSKDEI